MAGIVAAITGPGRLHTTPAACRLVNAAFFADLVQVPCSLQARNGACRDPAWHGCSQQAAEQLLL